MLFGYVCRRMYKTGSNIYSKLAQGKIFLLFSMDILMFSTAFKRHYSILHIALNILNRTPVHENNHMEL